MNDRLKDYVDLHLKLEAELPKLPDDATPEQIDKNQRAFEKLMREAPRDGASKATSSRPRRNRSSSGCSRPSSAGPTARQLKASIMDENPVDVALKLTVNGRYPDSVPLTTVPPAGAADAARS